MKQDRQIWLLVALCPATAVSDTFAGALGLGFALLMMCIVGALAARLLQHAPELSRTALSVLLLATVASTLSLYLDAWASDLRSTLGVFLPLLAVNLAIIQRVDNTHLRPLLLGGVQLLAVLILLGLARELVGRGALLDRSLFPADLGFLLAALPPGAFIAFGLLLGAHNWMRNRMTHRDTRPNR